MSVASPFANWSEFYDPEFYEYQIGEGDRVESAYLELTSRQSSTHIVEVGCGPGAIVFALADAGVQRVTGIDRSQAMIDRANRHLRGRKASAAAAITFECADLVKYAPHKPPDAVLLTNELVLHFLQPGELVGAFTHCRTALCTQGRIVLDLPEADYSLMAHASTPRLITIVRGTFPLGDTGQSVRVTEDVELDRANWIKTTQFRYELIAKDGTLSTTLYRRLKQRMWTVQEVQFALALAGFCRIERIALEGYPSRHFISAMGGQ